MSDQEWLESMFEKSAGAFGENFHIPFNDWLQLDAAFFDTGMGVYWIVSSPKSGKLGKSDLGEDDRILTELTAALELFSPAMILSSNWPLAVADFGILTLTVFSEFGRMMMPFLTCCPSIAIDASRCS